MESCMKIYIYIDERIITFTPAAAKSIIFNEFVGCSVCECQHNIFLDEFKETVVEFVNLGKCERTKYFYKTITRRLKLRQKLKQNTDI